MSSFKDLASITESILAETEEVQPAKSDPKHIDNGIQHIEVSDSMINAILESSKSKVEEQPTPAPKQDLTEAQKLEERMTSLVERLTGLLKEAKQDMAEMTSTGSIGVGVQTNLLAPKKKKKRKKVNGPC